MYLSISLKEQKKIDGNIHFRYLVEDTDFQAHIHVPIEQNIYDTRGDASIIPSGLISLYERQQYGAHDVAKNLAIFYTKNSMSIVPNKKILKTYVTYDMVWTDKYFPECKFGNKYYNCIRNQIDRLYYVGVVAKYYPDA